MLITRPYDTGRNTWSSSKLEVIYQKAASSRMSNFEPLQPQPDWREQYASFPLPGENALLRETFEQQMGSHQQENVPPIDPTLEESAPQPEEENQSRIVQLQQDLQPAGLVERPDSAQGDLGGQANNCIRDESLVSTESTAVSLASLGSNPTSSTSSAPTQPATLANSDDGDASSDLKEEDEVEDDDDDMLDVELGTDEAPRQQTAAERRAERRKMKRFRLTHQQTRFLMSEFAKQAHPDAAHRERLSREIPGLSPRQVQVWFQNRRAKIKRLTADDRDRMMKMRAVPDDFDNLQALHSPYGAVHGLGTPLTSPVDFVPSFTDHLMRPLMVDTMQRNDTDEHTSPTGLSPSFGHVGFAHGNAISANDLLSPLSLTSADRYYSSHVTSPMSAGPRSSNMFDRQSSYQAMPHTRQHNRPLQPLQLRETMSRTRSESLHSPLRTSMSWKGETLDYGNYQTGQSNSQLSGRQQSVYQHEQIGNSTVNAHQLNANAFSSSSASPRCCTLDADHALADRHIILDNTIQNSPPHSHMTFSPTHGPAASLHQSSPSGMSRLRSSSSVFPSGLDLRNQFRTVPSQHGSSQNMSTTHRSNSFAGAFTAGFASAPLTAPVDFSLPRKPNDGSQGTRDFNIPQLSAPMATSHDFSSAFNSNLSPTRVQHSDRSFRGLSQNRLDSSAVHGQTRNGDQQRRQGRSRDDSSFLRPVNYETGQRRKRSYTMPGSFQQSP